MRIISKFKDYYDSCMAYGQDNNLVYLRKGEELEVSPDCKFRTEIHNASRLHEDVVYMHRGLIGFCGKFYAYIRVYSYGDKFPSIRKTSYYYDYESLLKDYPNFGDTKGKGFLTKEIVPRLERDIKLWLNDKSWVSYSWGSRKQTPDTFNWKTLEKMFYDHKTPIFSLRDDRDSQTGYSITTNICLSERNFYKAMDAFTTFQELSMFLGNDLCSTQTPEMPVGDDVTIARSKGYDKYSFRKDKKVK